jgi:glucosamine--fructose-6-phosphate aminotransferase (isomerizing)
MCGIVGILGSGAVAGQLVDALKRLEYRGYDSAGVVTVDGGALKRSRAPGKLRNLQEKLERAPLSGAAGIGHTRWATHGAATETNAHPHIAPGVAVVHNGIIENHLELRREIEAEGARLSSETDTEVVAFLVSREIARGSSPKDAVAAVLPRLSGAFALAFVFENEPDLLIGARRGSPLAVGCGDNEMYFGSDALALAPLTEAHLLSGGGRLGRRHARRGRDLPDRPRRAAPEKVERPVRETAVIGAMIGKGNYRHFMEKEIHEQPAVIGDTLHSYLNPAAGTITVPDLPRLIRGPAESHDLRLRHRLLRGMVAKYWFESLARLPTEVDIGSELRYRETPLPRRRSGALHQPVRRDHGYAGGLRYAKSQGAAHPLHRQRAGKHHRAGVRRRAADQAGPEIGVASTKAFTTQLDGSRRARHGLRQGARDARPARERSWRLRWRRCRAAPPSRCITMPDIAEIARSLSRGARRLLHGPRHEFPDRHGRRAEAEGNLLHPCRRLRRRRDEARAHRADRGGRSRHRDRAAPARCSKRPPRTCRRW